MLPGQSRDIKPHPPDCLLAMVWHSPNKMYSAAYWDTEWVTSDTEALHEAQKTHGKRPKRGW